MRHGNGYKSWWKQERKDFVCSQLSKGIDLLTTLVFNAQDHYFCQYTSIYIRNDNQEIDKWRINFF